MAAAADVSIFLSAAAPDAAWLVASSIHAQSWRRNAALAVIHAGSGAARGFSTLLRRTGRDSEGGTLLVTGIDRSSAKVQADLFRFLEMRDGLGRPVVRVIAAAEGAGLTAVRAGRLREDLFYRLNIMHLVLPSRGVGGNAPAPR